MSYRVSTQGYSGPFDLLLQLVTRQKVDIGSISIAEVAEQYLAEVERIEALDLDVASDFLLVAATLLEGEPTHVTFTLWNSFAHTYRGHGTDRALVAGVLGLDTDDERIRDAFSLAEERGLDYKFVIGGDDPSIHPNTVDIALEKLEGIVVQCTRREPRRRQDAHQCD